VAFDQTCLRREKWQLEVLSIQDVAEVRITLGFIDAETAERLAKGKSTVTPQSGLKTVPLTTVAALTSLLDSESEPPSPEAQEGHMLIVQGATSEEDLSRAGFCMSPDGPLQ